MANIRIKDLPADGTPKQTDLIPIDLGSTRHATVKAVVESGRPNASKAEAEAGVEPQKAMTPLTTKQAIDAQVGATYVPKTVKVNAGSGMTGGGELSGDITVGLTVENVDRLTKVDGIEVGATKNETDAHLLARANHTGVQAISTVSGLQGALDGKLPVDGVAEDSDKLGGETAQEWADKINVGGIYDTKAAAEAANIPSSVNAIRLNGGNALGDGLGGLYSTVNNGSTDSFMSADSRTWYRAMDISTARLDTGIKFTSEGFRQSISPDYIQNNVGLSGTFAIKLEKPDFATSGSGFQGFTFVTETGVFYSTWNRPDLGNGERINICRHNRSGELIDYSTVVEGALGHGQDIDHLYIDGKLYLVTDNAGSQGCTFLLPGNGDQWIPDIKREFILQDPSVTSGTVKLSLDKKFVLKSGGPTSSGGKNFRMFRVDDLLAGPDGNRTDDGTTYWNMPQPIWANAGQAWLSDGTYNYHINGNTDVNNQNMLRVVRISDQKVVDEIQLNTLVDLAKLQNNGAGDRLEPEGAAWITPLSGGRPQMWAGFALRSPTSTAVQMMVAPVFQRDFGAVMANGNRSPLGIAANLSGGDHKIAWPRNERLSFSNYENTLEGTDVSTVMTLEAYKGLPAVLRVRGEGNGTYSGIVEIRRDNGGLKFIPSPVYFGGGVAPDLGEKSVYVDGNGRMVLSEANPNGPHILFRSDTAQAGTITSSGSTTLYNTTSDKNLKVDEVELSYEKAASILEMISLYEFKWKLSGERDIGVFAQELYKVYPRSVSVGGWFLEDGTEANEHDEGAAYQPWGVDYSKLMPVVIRVIQGLLK